MIGVAPKIIEEFCMKIVYAAAMTLILVAPAYAQSKSPTMEEMMGGKTPDQIEKEQAADKAYKESLKKIPDAKTSSDPWGTARGAEAPKTSAKTAAKTPAAKKPPAKTGSTAN
jgi:hypothetical protein